MNRFIQQMESQKSFPHFLKELDSFLPVTTVGSVNDTLVSSDTYIKHLHLSKTTNLSELIFSDSLVVPIGQMLQHALQTHEVLCLVQMYQTIRPVFNVLHVSCLCYRFSRAKLGKKLLSSQMAKSDRSSYVCANWLNKAHRIPADLDMCIFSSNTISCCKTKTRKRYLFRLSLHILDGTNHLLHYGTPSLNQQVLPPLCP